MRACLDPFSFLVVSLAGWLNQRQHQIIHYLVEENCVLREQMGRRRLRFTDDQRRRLAAKAKTLGRKVLAQVATIVTPETLLAWHRKLIWTCTGLTRFMVLFFIDLSTRRVEIAGIASSGNGLWMAQIARNLTDVIDGFFTGKRYLIHDRDPLYTKEFLSVIASSGIEAIKLPPSSPNLNAYAERFVRTIKESCLDQMIFFGEDMLRNTIREFVTHYHRERNHQGLDNRLLEPVEIIGTTTGLVRKRERVGGLLNYYYREAA